MTDTVRIYYYYHEPNFGDAANLRLCKKLSGKVPQLVLQPPAVTVMGSIMDHPDFPTTIWGSGVLHSSLRVRCKPERVVAVRGPLSRKWLLDQEIDCPEVYGDPGILFPKVFQRSQVVKYDIGIVPHYTDMNNPCLQNLPETVKVIDPLREPSRVIHDITECHNIVSSSLHGLVTADAYGIPRAWVSFSDNLVGFPFKFHDYHAAIGKTLEYVDLNGYTDLPIGEMVDWCVRCQVGHLIDGLLEACPFYEER